MTDSRASSSKPSTRISQGETQKGVLRTFTGDSPEANPDPESVYRQEFGEHSVSSMYMK